MWVKLRPVLTEIRLARRAKGIGYACMGLRSPSGVCKEVGSNHALERGEAGAYS